MGLDMVELVIEVEERFGIEIHDEDAADLATVGQFYRYILDQFDSDDTTEPSACLSASAFHALRRGLIECFGLNRREIQPAAAVEALVPAARRRSNWKRLGEALDLHLPNLVRPRWVAVVGVALFLVLTGFVADRWRVGPDDSAWSRVLEFALVWFVLGGLCYALLYFGLTRPLARVIPPNTRTVRDFVNELARRNYGRLARRGGGWDREEVWSILVQVISERLRVPTRAVTPEARFVEDLGAG